MIRLLVSWVLYAAALYGTASFVPGLSIEKGGKGIISALIGSVVLALINAIIYPILKFFTLPITFLTLGLFTFVLMGICFWLLTVFVPGIKTHGFIPCILGAVVFALLSWILHIVF
jgi:putative membrane protein